MKTKIAFPVIATLTALLLPAIQAARADNLLIAAKGGIQTFDFELEGKADPSLMAIIQMGYEFSTLGSMNLAGELEVSTSLNEGEVINRDFNIQNTVLSLSLRSTGARYYVGKIGIVSSEVDFVDFPNTDDTGAAFTLGMGFGKLVSWEIELSGYAYQDIGSSVLVAAGFRF